MAGITLQTIREIAVSENDSFMILVIDEMIKRPKVPLVEHCEACGRYSKNNKIHRKCKKWWV
jgi:hypothetical protein